MKTNHFSRMDALRDALNPLHIYCRIRKWTGNRLGLKIAKIYEFGIYIWVF
jgi:hypothetical protein